MSVMGTGELRKTHDRYVGHVLMGGRTIVLAAELEQDQDGPVLRLTATLANTESGDLERVLRGPVAPTRQTVGP